MAGLATGFNFDSANDDNLVARYYSKPVDTLLNLYAGYYGKKKLNSALDDYRSALSDVYPQATANANAQYYSGLTKDIVGDKNTYLTDYERLRSGNLESLGGVFKDVLDYGMAGEKARLAAGGYGNTGPSAYDKILSSTRTASNLTPVLSNIYNNLGREATASYGSREAHNQYLINLMQNDILGQYGQNAASRALLPYLTQMGLASSNIQGLQALGQAVRSNTSGYELVKGLTSRVSDADKDIWSMLTGGLYGQSYGSQPGQDTATTMGLIGTAASIYGGSNQYHPPQQQQQQQSPYWMGSYGSQYPTGGYDSYGMSYDSPQQQYYRAMLNSNAGTPLGSSGLGASGGYGAGLGIGL